MGTGLNHYVAGITGWKTIMISYWTKKEGIRPSDGIRGGGGSHLCCSAWCSSAGPSPPWVGTEVASGRRPPAPLPSHPTRIWGRSWCSRLEGRTGNRKSDCYHLRSLLPPLNRTMSELRLSAGGKTGTFPHKASPLEVVRPIGSQSVPKTLI